MADIIPRGSRVSLGGNILTALGTRSALNTQSALDKLARALAARGYTNVLTNGDWLGSNIAVDATLAGDKFGTEGIINDFVRAGSDAGFYGIGNARITGLTLAPPGGVAPISNLPPGGNDVGWPFNQLPDLNPLDDGDNTGLILGAAALVVLVVLLRRR